MPPSTRCTPCNTIYNRVLNAKKLMDNGSIGVWDDMEKEKINDFIMSIPRDLKGKPLKAKLQTYLSQELESKFSISIIGTGEFMDSPDLQKKYRDKPEQLKNLKESTRTLFCPNRKCNLYQDVTYTAGFTDEQTLTQKRRMDRESEEPIRAPKKPKVEPKQSIASGAGDTHRILNNLQTTRLDGFLKFLKTSQEELETLEADIKAVGRWIPPVASDKLKELQLLHKTKQTHCDKIKLKCECLDFNGFSKNMSEFKNELPPKKTAIQ